MTTTGRAPIDVDLLPVSRVVGFPVTNPVTVPDFEPCDPGAPPVDPAAPGAWEDEDGTLVCRAFHQRDRDALTDTLTLRSQVTDEKLAACQAAFRSYGSTEAGPGRSISTGGTSAWLMAVVGTPVLRLRQKPEAEATASDRPDPTGAAIPGGSRSPPDPDPPRPTIQSRILHQRGCLGWLMALALLAAALTALFGP